MPTGSVLLISSQAQRSIPTSRRLPPFPRRTRQIPRRRDGSRRGDFSVYIRVSSQQNYRNGSFLSQTLASGGVCATATRKEPPPRSPGRAPTAAAVIGPPRGLGHSLLLFLEYEPVVLEQLPLEADLVGAHTRGEREPEVGAGEPAREELQL